MTRNFRPNTRALAFETFSSTPTFAHDLTLSGQKLVLCDAGVWDGWQYDQIDGYCYVNRSADVIIEQGHVSGTWDLLQKFTCVSGSANEFSINLHAKYARARIIAVSGYTNEASGEIYRLGAWGKVFGPRTKMEGYNYATSGWQPMAVDASGQIEAKLTISDAISVSGNVINISGSAVTTSTSGNYVTEAPGVGAYTQPVLALKPLSGGTVLGTQACTAVAIKALNQNSGDVWLGGSGGHAPYSGKGYLLEAGEGVNIGINNFNQIYAFANVSGDKICCIGVNV